MKRLVQYLVSFSIPSVWRFSISPNPEDPRLWFPILGSYHYDVSRSFGGVIRDVLLNEEPVIFRKEIYAMACVSGPSTWALSPLGLEPLLQLLFLTVCIIRLLAVNSLPTLRDEEDKKE